MINDRGFDSVHHQGGFSRQALPLRSLGFFIPPFAHARMAHGKKKAQVSDLGLPSRAFSDLIFSISRLRTHTR